MNINEISIYGIKTGNLCCSAEDVYHIKSLSCMSVVQATCGNYDIRIADSQQYKLNENDVFIAPPNKMQYIRHHNNKILNIMHAHWLFFNVTINNEYALSDIYDFPVYLPSKYDDEINDYICCIESSNTYIQHAKAFEIVNIIMENSHMKKLEQNDMLKIKKYIYKNIYDNEKLSTKCLSEYLNISQPTFYRNFKKWFGVTSVEYIKNKRLDHAAMMLETTDMSIANISCRTGFYDNSQFDQQFKKKFGITPSQYRTKVNFQI